MLLKKYKKARLSTFSKIFFQLGLVLSLLITYFALEWKTVERKVDDLAGINYETEEIIDIPVTERIIESKPPPPPPPSPERIEIVRNTSDIEESVLQTTETDQSDIVEIRDVEKIDEVVEEEEVAEDVPFAIIEEAPVFPGCKGNKEQKKKCLEEKIKEYVSKNFNTRLASELGLSPGKKKVYVQFKIDKNGDIVDIKARGPHARLEKEAVRVVMKLPKMIPGKQRGRAVGVRYTLPITLIVEENI